MFLRLVLLNLFLLSSVRCAIDLKSTTYGEPSSFDPRSGNIYSKQLGGDFINGLSGAIFTPDASQNDQCSAVDSDSEGNIVCVGYTEGSLADANAGDKDVLVWKVSADGETLWVRQFGQNHQTGFGSYDASQEDSCTSVIIDDDDNIYCLGYTFGALADTNGGGADGLILKLSPEGDLLSSLQMGASYTSAAIPGFDATLSHKVVSALMKSNKAEFFVNLETLLLKMDRDFNVAWSMVTPRVGQLAIDSSGNIVATGTSCYKCDTADTRHGDLDIYLSKIRESDGALLWQKQYGQSVWGAAMAGHQAWEFVKSMTLDKDDNIYVGGYGRESEISEPPNSDNGYRNAFVVKSDPDGNKQWIRQFGTETLDPQTSQPIPGTSNCAGLVDNGDGSISCIMYSIGSWTDEGVDLENDIIISTLSSQTGELLHVRQLGASFGTTYPNPWFLAAHARFNESTNSIKKDNHGNILIAVSCSECEYGDTMTGGLEANFLRILHSDLLITAESD